MDGLRWILLLAGVIVIAGVVLFGRRQSSGDSKAPPAKTARSSKAASKRVAPSLGGRRGPDEDDTNQDGPDFDTDDDGANAARGDQVDIEDVVGGPEAPDLEGVPQKIVTVRIVRSDKASFPGDKLVLSLRGIGMRHGRFGIFHRYDGNDEDRVVFSAASLVEPGSFELENIRDQKIPGISLFMVLPGPLDGAEAFDLMMAASRTLTKSLGGDLLDESGSTLSIQRERYLREEIIQYQLENRQV